MADSNERDEIPQPAMVGDDPERDRFAGRIDATKSNGVEVPVEFTFTYPRGEGMVLWQLIRQFSERISDQVVFEHLMETGDSSLLARAAEMGAYDEEED